MDGILVAFLADQPNYRQASYVFLLIAVALMAGVALLLGPSILAILFGIKRGGEIAIAPYIYVPTRWLAWSAFISGIAFCCIVVMGIFLLLRTKEREPGRS